MLTFGSTVSAPIKDSDAFCHIYADFTTALDARFGLESARRASTNLIVRFAWKTDDFNQASENKELHAIESFIKSQEWMLAGLRKEAEKMGITLTFGLNVGANSQAVIYNEQGLLVEEEEKKALEDETGSVIRTPNAAGKNLLVKHWLRDQFPDADQETQTDTADIQEQGIPTLAASLTLSHVSMSQGIADIADVPVSVSLNEETVKSSDFPWSQVDRPDPIEATIIGATAVEPQICEKPAQIIDNLEIAPASPTNETDSTGIEVTLSEDFLGCPLGPVVQYPEELVPAVPDSDIVMQEGTSIDVVHAWEFDSGLGRQDTLQSAEETTGEPNDAGVGRFDDPVSEMSTSPSLADISGEMTWVNGTANASVAASPTLVNGVEATHYATPDEVQPHYDDDMSLFNVSFDANDNVSEISTSPSLAELANELSLSLINRGEQDPFIDAPLHKEEDISSPVHEDSHHNSVGATKNNTHTATPIARRQELHRQISSADLASALAALDVISEDPVMQAGSSHDATGVEEQYHGVPAVQLNGDDVGDTSLLNAAPEPRLVNEGIPCALLVAGCAEVIEIFMDIVPEQYHDLVADIEETQGTKFFIVKFYSPTLAKEVYSGLALKYTEEDFDKREKGVPFVKLLQEDFEFFDTLPKVGQIQGKNIMNGLQIQTVDHASEEKLTDDAGGQDNATAIASNTICKHGEGNKNKSQVFDFPELYEFDEGIETEKKEDMEIDLSMFS